MLVAKHFVNSLVVKTNNLYKNKTCSLQGDIIKFCSESLW